MLINQWISLKIMFTNRSINFNNNKETSSLSMSDSVNVNK